jgi:hypothetical protein
MKPGLPLLFIMLSWWSLFGSKLIQLSNSAKAAGIKEVFIKK